MDPQMITGFCLGILFWHMDTSDDFQALCMLQLNLEIGNFFNRYKLEDKKVNEKILSFQSSV
jgi:hypothetical protein